MRSIKRTAFLIMLVLLLYSHLALAVSYRPSDFIDLRYGYSGDEVKQLQLRLMELGFFAGPADGIYGQSTENALTLFCDLNEFDRTQGATAQLQAAMFSDGTLDAYGNSHTGYQPNKPDSSYGYIANTNSGVYHRSSCKYIKKMKKENKLPITKQHAESQGYRSCKFCHP